MDYIFNSFNVKLNYCVYFNIHHTVEKRVDFLPLCLLACVNRLSDCFSDMLKKDFVLGETIIPRVYDINRGITTDLMQSFTGFCYVTFAVICMFINDNQVDFGEYLDG